MARKSAPPPTYSMTVLSRISGFSERTIHYYIQQRLVPRPDGGATSAATYGSHHLQALLKVRELKDRGMNRKRIQQYLSQQGGQRRPGDTQAGRFVCIGPGLELLILREASPLSAEAERRFVAGALRLLDEIMGDEARPVVEDGQTDSQRRE